MPRAAWSAPSRCGPSTTSGNKGPMPPSSSSEQWSHSMQPHSRHPPMHRGGPSWGRLRQRGRRRATRAGSSSQTCLTHPSRRSRITRSRCCLPSSGGWWALTTPCTTGCGSVILRALRQSKQHPPGVGTHARDHRVRSNWEGACPEGSPHLPAYRRGGSDRSRRSGPGDSVPSCCRSRTSSLRPTTSASTPHSTPGRGT